MIQAKKRTASQEAVERMRAGLRVRGGTLWSGPSFAPSALRWAKRVSEDLARARAVCLVGDLEAVEKAHADVVFALHLAIRHGKPAGGAR